MPWSDGTWGLRSRNMASKETPKWLDLQMEGLQALVSEIEAAGGAAGEGLSLGRS
jgi:hypothetical protein